jgi:uncharacterized protein (TIGR02679 family)
MNDAPEARLQRLLGNDALATVRLQLRRQFERAEPGTAPERLQLTKLDAAAHAALCQLTGRPSRLAASMTLDRATLDERLRAAGLASTLRDALEKLDGPIVSRAALRREIEAHWSALATAATADTRLRAWQGTPAAITLLKRIGREPARAAALLDAADRVLRRLPGAGITRSQLAAETLGDAHGLDNGRALATIVLAVLRHDAADRCPDDAVAGVDGEERVRDVWARTGVLVSELARPVLTLNLPAPPDAAIAGGPGEPAYFSLRYLLRRRPAWPVAGRTVHVCENPDVVAIAADRLGGRCAPLVCTEGMPAAAQRTLLDQLGAAGARLLYHGDFDWAGIGIGNFVIRTWGAQPWRYRAADYLVAVVRAPARPRDLPTSNVTADWDAELAPAMGRSGLCVAEEAVAEALIGDLRLTG